MVLPYTLFRRQITEHIRLLMIGSAHTLVLNQYAVELKLLFQHTVRTVATVKWETDVAAIEINHSCIPLELEHARYIDSQRGTF